MLNNPSAAGELASEFRSRFRESFKIHRRHTQVLKTGEILLVASAEAPKTLIDPSLSFFKQGIDKGYTNTAKEETVFGLYQCGNIRVLVVLHAEPWEKAKLHGVQTKEWLYVDKEKYDSNQSFKTQKTLAMTDQGQQGVHVSETRRHQVFRFCVVDRLLVWADHERCSFSVLPLDALTEAKGKVGHAQTANLADEDGVFFWAKAAYSCFDVPQIFKGISDKEFERGDLIISELDEQSV